MLNLVCVVVSLSLLPALSAPQISSRLTQSADARSGPAPPTEAPPKAATAKGGTSAPASAQTRKPHFGAEIAVLGVRTARVRGRVLITAEGAGCLNVTASGELTTRGPVEAAAPLRFAFTPGAQHEYRGEVCLPVGTVPEGSRWRGNVEPVSQAGTMSFKGSSAILTGGPFKVTGGLSMPAQFAGKVVRVSGDVADPLVLLLTSNGYEYLSGRGAVTGPDGKAYHWP
jgi:hypothetical protein